MPDTVDQSTRSRMMSGIRARDTGPELVVRRWLHARGFRYRLHVRGLPGRPDIVLPRYGAVIFVNGCFWHRHTGCRFAYEPKTNVNFWATKFAATIERDHRQSVALQNQGWRVYTVWECQVRGEAHLSAIETELRTIAAAVSSELRSTRRPKSPRPT